MSTYRLAAVALLAAALAACNEPSPSVPAPPLAASAPASAPEAKAPAVAPDLAAERDTLLDQLSGVWKPTDEQMLLTIAVSDDGSGADILLSREYLTAEVENVDVHNGIVVMLVDMNGVPATWSFRRIVDAQGAAHFRATLHTGSESELSFVREASQSDMAALSEAAEQDRINRNAEQAARHEAAPAASR